MIPTAKAVRHQLAPNLAVVRQVAVAPETLPCTPTFAGARPLGPVADDFAMTGAGSPEEFGAVGPAGSPGLAFAGGSPASGDDGSAVGGGGNGGGGGGSGPGGPGGPGLPPVSSNAPEPELWALMIIGFGALGGAMRYSRRPNVVAAKPVPTPLV